MSNSAVGRIVAWFEDSLLRWLQRRCRHPDVMIAADILEGRHPDMHVSYCRRCGAVRPEPDWRYIESHLPWRLPDPFLWKGL
jgi:hypothetical protein